MMLIGEHLVSSSGLVSPLKWAGGKKWLILKYPELFDQFRTYIEPFFGGGVIFLAHQPKAAIINDLNPELLNVYNSIRNARTRVGSLSLDGRGLLLKAVKAWKPFRTPLDFRPNPPKTLKSWFKVNSAKARQPPKLLISLKWLQLRATMLFLSH